MKHAVLASLVLAATAGTASARRIPVPEPMPPAPPAAPMKSCRMAGTPIFEIRHRSDTSAAGSTVRVYASGAWSFEPVAEDGTRGALTGGCLDRRDMRAVKSALRSAEWDITFMRIACFAYDPTYTDYVVRGRVMFHDQLCSGARVDEKTRASLDTIVAALPRH